MRWPFRRSRAPSAKNAHGRTRRAASRKNVPLRREQRHSGHGAGRPARHEFLQRKPCDVVFPDLLQGVRRKQRPGISLRRLRPEGQRLAGHGMRKMQLRRPERRRAAVIPAAVLAVAGERPAA